MVCSPRLACADTALAPTAAAAWDPGMANACACLLSSTGTVPEESSLGSRVPAHPPAVQKHRFWEQAEAQG